MKKLVLATVVSLGVSFSALAVDFSSNFTTGTKSVVTTGEVKITGTSKEWSNVELKGIKADYDISVYPCSNCSGTVDSGNDYTVVGDYKSWSKTVTALNITQTIDSAGTGTICDVSTELGAFKAGNSSERMVFTSTTISDNQSTSVAKGGDLYTGVVYDAGSQIGTISEGSDYHQNINTDVQTVTTEHKTSYNVKSYFGN